MRENAHFIHGWKRHQFALAGRYRLPLLHPVPRDFALRFGAGLFYSCRAFGLCPDVQVFLDRLQAFKKFELPHVVLRWIGMSEVSLTPTERARKGVQLALQRLQDAGTASQVAVSMGVSESTISRIKNERLEETLLMLAHLGVKCVPTDFKCVDRATYDFLTTTHQRVMRRAPELIWDSEE